MPQGTLLDAIVPGFTIGFIALVVLGIAGAVIGDTVGSLEDLRRLHIDVWPLVAAVPGVPLYGWIVSRQMVRQSTEPASASLHWAVGAGGVLAGMLTHLGGLLAVAIANGPVAGTGGPVYMEPFGFTEGGTSLNAAAVARALGLWLVILMIPLGIVAGGLSFWAARHSKVGILRRNAA